MTRLRLFLFGSTIVWGIAIAIMIKSSMDSLSVPPWGNPVGDDRSPAIADGTQVGQWFVAPYPGLYRIEVWLDPAAVGSPQPMAFHLQVGSGATSDLLTTSLRTSDLQTDVPYAVEFEPVRNSEGEDFYFYVESSALPQEAVTVHYSPDAVVEGACPECKKDTSAVVNGQPASGNLQFYTYYSLRTRDKVALLLTRLAGGRPYLFGTKGYYLVLAACYVLLLAAFLWRVAYAILENERS